MLLMPPPLPSGTVYNSVEIAVRVAHDVRAARGDRVRRYAGIVSSQARVAGPR